MKSLKNRTFFIFLLLCIFLPINGFTLEIGGILNESTSLKAENNPHILKSSLTIPKDISLNIEAGTIIKVEKGATQIRVYGDLNAIGTSNVPIVITSGDSEPKAGDWDYIEFHQGSTGILKYVTIEYAGEGGNKSLYLHSSIIVDHVAISHGSTGIEILDSAAPTISSCKIDNMTEYGIIASSSGNYKIINSSLKGNIGALNITFNNNTPIISDNNYTGSGNHESALIAGTITGEIIFDNDVMLVGAVSVATDATLTFNPGITIFAKESNSRLIISGTLYAEANGDADRIIFTSDELEPKAGDWDYIEFHQGSAGILKYVTIEYAGEGGNKSLYLHSSIIVDHVAISHGSTGIEILDSAAPTISSCKIDNMTEYGIIARSSGNYKITNSSFKGNIGALNISLNNNTPIITGNNYTGSGNHESALIAGIITGEMIFDNDVTLVGSVRVATGATLTFNPGITIFAKENNSRLIISGALYAEASENTDRIIFTSDELEPKAGDWDYIEFHQGSTGILKYVTIEYAGEGGNKSLYLHSSIELDHVTIKHGYIGIEILDSAMPVIQNCVITDMNSWGIYSKTSKKLILYNDAIYNNGSGVYTSGVEIDARKVYWGHESGPYHPGLNPSGQGNEVSDNVIFDPWLKLEKGDLNHDNNISLADAIIALQICADINNKEILLPISFINNKADLKTALFITVVIANSE